MLLAAEAFNFLNEILNILEFILYGSLGAVIAYLSTRAKKKGEKHEIAELTKEVQEVKQFYTKEFEFLKKQLEAANSRENVLFNEKKETIVQLLSHLDNCFNCISDLNPNKIYYDKRKLLKEAEVINNYSDSVFYYFNKLNLFASNEKLLKYGEEVVQITHEWHDAILQLYENIQWIREYNPLISYEEEISEIKRLIEDFRKKERNFVTKMGYKTKRILGEARQELKIDDVKHLKETKG